MNAYVTCPRHVHVAISPFLLLQSSWMEGDETSIVFTLLERMNNEIYEREAFNDRF